MTYQCLDNNTRHLATNHNTPATTKQHFINHPEHPSNDNFILCMKKFQLYIQYVYLNKNVSSMYNLRMT